MTDKINKKRKAAVPPIAELLTDYDAYLFHQGSHFFSYGMLGAHPFVSEGTKGVRFALWAPNAEAVRVVGEFNAWDGQKHCLKRIKETGIWAAFFTDAREGNLYKYEIHTRSGQILLKADPYAFSSELRPNTASRITFLKDYPWQDHEWQERKKMAASYQMPLNVYEVHAGSWRRNSDGSFYSYRQLADELVDYVADMGYTHIEFMPLTEHPFDRSWGYQATGYYSVTSRYGSPADLKYLVDKCHCHNIGVILDWVPGHFCRDAHGLSYFDGTPTFEYEDPRKADNAGWGTLNFDLGKPEVMSFLISNAIYWLDVFHIDGLRVDAVASILYLDYGRTAGQWAPNCNGGNENIEGINFLRKLNEVAFNYFPDVLMMAEESTAWPLVSGPTYMGGLGFNYKWNMGWMNDTLRYMQEDPVNRKWHHNRLTFSIMYTFSENFILPFSHDEVVHSKKSLLCKMPGDYWQMFANMRLLLGYMMTHPGKKLLFMGGELGQFNEWDESGSLDWGLLDYEMHRNFHDFVRAINNFYLEEKSLWELDRHHDGFRWIEPNDSQHSILLYTRWSADGKDFLIMVLNFTPVPRENYRIGVPAEGLYREVFNSDQERYGGSGIRNEDIASEAVPWHSYPNSIRVTMPPLAMVIFKYFPV